MIHGKMKLTKMENRLQTDYKLGKYVRVRLSRNEGLELQQAATSTLARLEGAYIIR